jgi:hypothetical protein
MSLYKNNRRRIGIAININRKEMSVELKDFLLTRQSHQQGKVIAIKDNRYLLHDRLCRQNKVIMA